MSLSIGLACWAWTCLVLWLGYRAGRAIERHALSDFWMAERRGRRQAK